MTNGPKGPSNPPSLLGALQAGNAIHQQLASQVAQNAANQQHSAQMQPFFRNSGWGQNIPRAKDPTITPTLMLELLACGFTGEEIDKLAELAMKVAKSYERFDRVDMPVFYRRDARARSKCPFGTSRLYKKSHEVGTKHRPATVVYTPRRGFIRPFPEVK